MVTQDQVASYRRDFDGPASQQPEFWVAAAWLVFYLLAVVIVAVENFETNKVIEFAVTLGTGLF